MRKSIITIAVLGTAAAVTLSACSSSSSGKPSTNSSGSNSAGGGSSSTTTTSGQPKAACSLTNPPKSTATVPTLTTDTVSGKPKVGVILPDTISSPRYVLYDKPLLTKYLTAAGIVPNIQNAMNSTATAAQDAQSMIASGIKVLILDSINPQSGAGIEQAATKAGVKVIDYDRVNLGGTAQYYVSFDNQEVGRLQAQSMVDCLNQDGVKDPRIIMEDGGTDVDNNAVLFAKGAHQILDPLQKAGKLKIVSEVVDKGWDPTTAGPTFQQALTAAGRNVQGVLAANDNIANSVVGVLKSVGLEGKVVVTGQDSGTEGLQNIINGYQSMTIFKNVKYEAQAASDLAIALLKGESASKAGLKLSPFTDPTDANHHIEALLLPAQVITQNNISDVIKAGALTKAAICKGVTSQCAALHVG